ncbi:MnhB domain-containing protein [Nocardioides sp. DS6]|uniref:MnhB domain-containing protein n=1 Tax=Nocardioides eburneus TaxID=3231482 RepID=A0ABV3T280_9ACTN
MRARLTVLLAGAAMLVLAVVGVRALIHLPGAGDVAHPYGARAVAAAFHHATANAVMSVTLDQRGFDTLGEEFVLLAAAVGTVLLLRELTAEREEEAAHTYGPEDVFEAVRLAGYVLLPVTLLVGGYVVVHGHLTPGGGFQGGTVLATGLYLAYLAADYRALDRLRPPGVFDAAEGLGAFAYVAVGVGGLLAGSGFLADWLPWGQLGKPLSAGTVPLLNIAIGIEVGSAFVLVVAKFLEQALTVPEQAAEEG